MFYVAECLACREAILVPSSVVVPIPDVVEGVGPVFCVASAEARTIVRCPFHGEPVAPLRYVELAELRRRGSIIGAGDLTAFRLADDLNLDALADAPPALDVREAALVLRLMARPGFGEWLRGLAQPAPKPDGPEGHDLR